MLQEVLGLPEDEKLIWELSGGQQKMVSLSLTFLHSPRLLILDEPTVGSDPVLGNCIWNYLHECCKQNISVIIVTHYIEEAAFAHVVGIMREGTILEEGEPSSLIARYKVTTLEDVFLHLCTTGSVHHKSTTAEIEAAPVAASPVVEPAVEEKDESAGSQPDFVRNTFLNLWILSVLIRKNLTRFFQFNISFLIFLIPAFQALILCTLYNRDAIPVRGMYAYAVLALTSYPQGQHCGVQRGSESTLQQPTTQLDRKGGRLLPEPNILRFVRCSYWRNHGW